MSDETTAEMLAEIDRDLADIEKAVSALQQQAAQANYPQQVETTTDRLAEIEQQAEPQPVQVQEGRWRTRNGEIRKVTPTPSVDSMADIFPWHDAAGRRHRQLWRDDGKFINGVQEHGDDLVEYLGPIQPEPEPEKIITPDDVAAQALAGVWDQGKAEQEIAELQAQVRFLKNRELTLGTRLEEEKAVTTKRLQQIQLLRGEVSYVQGLLGESRRRAEELETLVADLRAVNATTDPQPQPQPVHLQAMIDSQAETIARLHSEIHGLSIQNAELLAQREAVKDELVQVSKDRQALQIELDAYELRSHNVSDRFEEGWDAGTAQAVETIAEWTEPFRQMIEKADNLVESDRASRLCAEIMQSLPAIMRSLTGLADED